MSIHSSGAVGLLVLALTGPLVAAEPFRVHSRIYNAADEPTGESLTIFNGSEAFDYVDAVGEVTVFQPDKQRFVILSTRDEVKTELTFDEIETVLEQYRTAALQRAEDEGKSTEASRRERARMVRFLLNPSFSRKLDEKTGVFEFSSVFLTYRIRTAPAPRPELAERVRQHSDWQGRLASLLGPDGMPPYARLAVNEVLAKKKLIPLEVGLEISAPGRRIQLKAAHEIKAELSDADRERIDTARRQMKVFPLVTLREYRQKVNAHEPAK